MADAWTTWTADDRKTRVEWSDGFKLHHRVYTAPVDKATAESQCPSRGTVLPGYTGQGPCVPMLKMVIADQKGGSASTEVDLVFSEPISYGH